MCSDNRVPDEKNGPRAKNEYEPMNKFKSKVQHNNNNNKRSPWCRGGVGKARFQQSDDDTSGTGEKETQQQNVVGKKIILT